MSERINLDDNMMSIVSKMSDGNPGAMNVIMEILKPNNIDPDNALGGVGVILSLDSLGIYGSDIYILSNDICDRDLVKTLAVLRAWQLGFLNGDTLKDACSRQDRSGVKMIPVDDLYIKVKKELPNFDLK